MSKPSDSQVEQINQRKQDHINSVLNDPLVDRGNGGFEQMQLMHRALPQLNFKQLDSTTEFLNKKLDFPLMIASMTGGRGENLQKINGHLAEAAQQANIALAVGSQRAMIMDQVAQQSFAIRQYAPDIPLIANMGAVQLNYGFGEDEARKAIDILEADALYLHLNPLQELIQPEGDTNFAGLADKIHNLANKIEVPIILKEVGCGLSSQDIELGLEAGIQHFDVAGRGGTSWSRIESHRSDNPLGVAFQDWGLTTLQSLKIALPYQNQATFIASGGIRNGIDMIKAVIMGGRVCGIAAPFLAPAQDSTTAVLSQIAQFKQEFQTAQFLLGIEKAHQLHLNKQLYQNKQTF